MEKTNHKKENKTKSSPLVSLVNNTWRNILVQINPGAVLGKDFADKLGSIAYCFGSTYSYTDWEPVPGQEDLARVTTSGAIFQDKKIIIHCYESSDSISPDYFCGLGIIKKNAPEGISFVDREIKPVVRLKNQKYFHWGFYSRGGIPSISRLNEWLDHVNSYIKKSKS